MNVDKENFVEMEEAIKKNIDHADFIAILAYLDGVILHINGTFFQPLRSS